jgi:pyrimidine operon attenuation protein/uracil phosphoribosyltransferase
VPVKSRVIDSQGFGRTITRLAHEILERNRGSESIAVIGIRTRGEYLARRLAAKIAEMEQRDIALGFLDITLYRDDLRHRLDQPVLQGSEISFDVSGKNIILVDDVLFTGRTVRAALDEIVDMGRPASIQLAVMVDRGHRELPIRADYVGKNIPTSLNEEVRVLMHEIDGEDAVDVQKKEGP